MSNAAPHEKPTAKLAARVGERIAMSLQQLKNELVEVADSPNRFQPEMMKLALRLFSQIFVAEHPDTGNGTLTADG